MPYAPGQSGNLNGARKPKAWEGAVRRALAQRDLRYKDETEGATLRRIAEAQIDKALEGDKDATILLRDTLDGKPVQRTEVSGEDGGPMQIAAIEVILKRASETAG